MRKLRLVNILFLNTESIRGFTSTFVDICSATLYKFGFPSIIKRPPLEILKFLVTTLSNQDKKVSIIRVYEYGALTRYSEFMCTFHKMNIIVQNSGVGASSRNGKSKISNKTLDNIKKYLLLKLSHNQDIWCFVYQYTIWIYRRTENRLRGDFHYFLWNGSIPSYKHIIIWGVRVYIINGHFTRKILMIYHIPFI